MIVRRRLVSRILDPDVRFISIVGQAGSGRTELMYEVSSQCAGATFSIMPGWDRLEESIKACYVDSLRMPPEGRRFVAVGSSPAAQLPFTAMPPQHVCIIDDADLAFTLDEVACILKDAGATPDFASYVSSVTGGYAAAVHFMRRVLRNEGEAAARDLSSSRYAPLMRFIFENVIAKLSEGERALLMTIAATDADAGDVLQALLPNVDVPSSLELLHRRRLVFKEHGEAAISPLVLYSLNACGSGELERYAQKTMAYFRANDDHVSAAQAAAHVGALDVIAGELLRAPLSKILSPDPALDRAVARLPEAMITAEPRLWIAAWRTRRLVIDSRVMETEARTLVEMADGHDPQAVRVLRGLLAFVCAENNNLEEADELFTELYPPEALERAEALETADVIVCGLRAAVYTMQGRIAQATAILRKLNRAAPASPVLASLTTSMNIRRARMEGNWLAEKAFHQRAVEMARAQRDPWPLAQALSEFAFAAAQAGDHAAVENARMQLRAITERHAMQPFDGHAAAMSDAEAACAFGVPWMRAEMAFIRAFYSSTKDDAATQLSQAIENADQSCAFWMQAMLRVAFAQVAPARAEEVLDEAQALAEKIPSKALCGAISHARMGELPQRGQPCRNVIAHFRALPSASGQPHELQLNVLCGTVVRNGNVLQISRKVFDLLTALATRGRPIERDELCDMLWPDDEPQSAANALKMTVRRARLQCGDANVVLFSDNKYMLGAHVALDVKRVRAACEAAFKSANVLNQHWDELAQYYRDLAGGPPLHLAEYEWFVGTYAALQNLQIELGSALARNAIERDDTELVRALVPAMLECDPCDEQAWELIVRSHVGKGEIQAARRAIEEYVSLTKRSECAPSPRIVHYLQQIA